MQVVRVMIGGIHNFKRDLQSQLALHDHMMIRTLLTSPESNMSNCGDACHDGCNTTYIDKHSNSIHEARSMPLKWRFADLANICCESSEDLAEYR